MKIKPTESELEILQILWENGPCSVRVVNDELNKVKDSGYTTTLKLMQIMTEKGLADRDTTARTHIYRANASESGIKKDLVKRFIISTFQGSASELVMSALGSSKTSPEDLKEIKDLISRIEKDQINDTSNN